jgi:hypothetical protein
MVFMEPESSQSILTLNLRGKSHVKGLPEDADVKAYEGFLCPLVGFFRSLIITS